MAAEPSSKRVLAFFDGQNLFHAAQNAFGSSYPDFDVDKLTTEICTQRGWTPEGVRFYTGVPDKQDNAQWNHFWIAKLAQMGRDKVYTYSRPLRYRNQTVHLPDGTDFVFKVGQEKGIDIRIALDIVRLAHQKAYDIALVFSQDQDLSETADELRVISNEQQRWIKIVSAFPVGPGTKNKRGINKTDWLQIDQNIYQSCIDKRDYRPKKRL